MAALLLGVRRLEGGDEQTEETVRLLLEELGPELLARLACTDVPAVRSAALTLLALLPPASTPPFAPFLPSLLRAGEALPDDAQAEALLGFVADCLLHRGAAAALRFAEQVVLQPRTPQRPARALALLGALLPGLPAPLALCAEASAELRALCVRSLYGGDEVQRRRALSCMALLLREGEGAWTVESDGPRGAFASTLCSIVRGELELQLDARVPDPEALRSLGALLEGALRLLLGHADGDCSGVWSALPAEALLGVRASALGALGELLAAPLHAQAVRFVLPALCMWAAHDRTLALALVRQWTPLSSHAGALGPLSSFALAVLEEEEEEEGGAALVGAVLDAVTVQGGALHSALGSVEGAGLAAAVLRLRGADMRALLPSEGARVWPELLGCTEEEMATFAGRLRSLVLQSSPGELLGHALAALEVLDSLAVR